jgi:DDE family transposase
VFVIGNIPKRFKEFFRNLECFFEKRQLPHFWTLVLVFSMAHGRRNIRHLNLFLIDRSHRQRHQDFLVESPWEAPRVLLAGGRSILKKLNPQKGELLEILIDLSHSSKRGKTMEAAHRYFDPVTKSYQFGHAFLACTLRFRGVTIPWALSIWSPRSFCRSERGKELGLKFKTSNQLAAEVIKNFPADLAAFFQIRVLFDSGFLNEEVASACKKRGFHFMSVAKSNRTFFPIGYSGKRTVSSYGPGVVRTCGQTIQIPGYRGRAKFRVAVRQGFMRGLGEVMVVFSQRLSDGSFVALVTDDMKMTAREVVIGYKSRWPIEVMLKNLKQYLGLGQYQTTRYEGLIHHLHLSLISLQLLTTLSLEGSAEKLSRGAAIEIESIPILQERLRMLVAKDHMSCLRKSKSVSRILSRLKELLIAV